MPTYTYDNNDDKIPVEHKRRYGSKHRCHPFRNTTCLYLPSYSDKHSMLQENTAITFSGGPISLPADHERQRQLVQRARKRPRHVLPTSSHERIWAEQSSEPVGCRIRASLRTRLRDARKVIEPFRKVVHPAGDPHACLHETGLPARRHGILDQGADKPANLVE